MEAQERWRTRYGEAPTPASLAQAARFCTLQLLRRDPHDRLRRRSGGSLRRLDTGYKRIAHHDIRRKLPLVNFETVVRVQDLQDAAHDDGRGIQRSLVFAGISSLYRRKKKSTIFRLDTPTDDREGGEMAVHAYLRPASAACISSSSARIVRPAKKPDVKLTGCPSCEPTLRGR